MKLTRRGAILATAIAGFAGLGIGQAWLQNLAQAQARMVEAPILGSLTSAFTRTLALLPDNSGIINLTTSGFTVLGWNYDASAATPQISKVTNAADRSKGVAPGGLIVVEGKNLSAVNIASQEKPLPLALGESCLSVNGLAVPIGKPSDAARKS